MYLSGHVQRHACKAVPEVRSPTRARTRTPLCAAAIPVRFRCSSLHIAWFRAPNWLRYGTATLAPLVLSQLLYDNGDGITVKETQGVRSLYFGGYVCDLGSPSRASSSPSSCFSRATQHAGRFIPSSIILAAGGDPSFLTLKDCTLHLAGSNTGPRGRDGLRVRLAALRR